MRSGCIRTPHPPSKTLVKKILRVGPTNLHFSKSLGSTQALPTVRTTTLGDSWVKPQWSPRSIWLNNELLSFLCLGANVISMPLCVCMTTVKYPKLNPLSFLFHATLSISLYSFCCYPYISSSSTTIWLCLLIYSPPFLCLCLACYSSPSFFVSKVNILGSGFILLRFKYWLPLSGCVLGKFCCGGVPSKWDC